MFPPASGKLYRDTEFKSTTANSTDVQYVCSSAEETKVAWDLPRFRFGNGRALGSGELLRRFCLLPLVEPKPSNKDSVARRSMSGSVALRRLAPLVVVSAFLDPDPEPACVPRLGRWKRLFHATAALFLSLLQIRTRCCLQHVTGPGKVAQQPSC